MEKIIVSEFSSEYSYNIACERLGYDPKEQMIDCTKGPTSGFKSWIAEIKGTHPTYKFDRKFLRNETYGDGTFGICLKEGTIYNWTAYKKNVFGRLQNGVLEILDEKEVNEILANK